jgi:cold-inducible RNA-binding protein
VENGLFTCYDFTVLDSDRHAAYSVACLFLLRTAKSETRKRNTMKKIFVGNFSFSLSEGELRSMFEPFGAVDSATVVTDRATGRSRGFGFVEMPNNDEAEKAIAALNGKDSGGRQLTVNEARPKVERGGGGGRDDYRGHARQPREPRW